MNTHSTLFIIVVVVIAFIAGYAILSFIINRIQQIRKDLRAERDDLQRELFHISRDIRQNDPEHEGERNQKNQPFG